MESKPEFSDLTLEFPTEEIAVISFNRPKKLNALTFSLFKELKAAFDFCSNSREVRVVIIKGNGKVFTSGLDIMDANINIFGEAISHSEDTGRRAILYQKFLQELQDCISSAEKCKVPVIAAIHGHCIGAGVDLSAACDIRLASKCAKFSIKEIDIGLAADIGTLQRFPKVVGNNAWARELAMTARTFDAQEALENGYLSHVYDSVEELNTEAMKLAQTIASKSPVAVVGYKNVLNFSRDHTIADGLYHIKILNSTLLQSEDTMNAIMGLMSKSTPKFAKL